MSILLIVSLICLSAFTGCKTKVPEFLEENNFKFRRIETKSGKQFLAATYVGNEERIVIPSKTKDGYPVKAVVGYDFTENDTVKSVTVSEGIEIIGANAFSGYSALESVTLPSTITVMSDYCVFSDCPNLKSFAFSKKNRNYYVEGNCIIERKTERLIAGCNASVIPDAVKEIGGMAFYHMTALTDLRIPDGVSKIGNRAFSACTGLRNVEIPPSVSEIGFNAFSEMPDLTVSVDHATRPSGWDPKWMGDEEEEADQMPTVVWKGEEKDA